MHSDGPYEEGCSSEDAPQEYSFDELAGGLAGGALSRGRAMKLVGAFVLGGLLGGRVLAMPAAEARRHRRRRSLAATEPGTSQLTTVTIINSLGERVPVRVEIADTPAETQRGLMGRTSLAEDAGMLFVFEQEEQLSFWMKNTLIPLSVAFINGERLIVDIQDMQPLDETPHLSAEPARYALEVNQGFFEERGVMVGDRVELPG